MSPQAKIDTSKFIVILSVTVGIFVTVIGTTVKVTSRFNAVDSQLVENDKDHVFLKTAVKEASKEAISSNQELLLVVKEASKEQRAIKENQVKVMINQERIKEDIQELSDKIP